MRRVLGALRDVRTLAHSVREQGLRHTGRVCALAIRGRWMAAADRRREAQFGVSSEGRVALHELAIDSESRALGFPYVPSPGLLVDTLLFNLEEDLSRFCFIDFGSGKGRVLLVASHYPFREVVGVEFAPELHQIAQTTSTSTPVPRAAARTSARSAPTRPRSRSRSRSACSTSTTRSPNRSSPGCFANIQVAQERAHRKVYVLYQQLAGDLETDRTRQHREAATLRLPP